MDDKESVDYYIKARKFFQDEELEDSWSIVFAYANMGVSVLQLAWSVVQVILLYSSKFYFFELGTSLGRATAHLYTLVDWIVNFDKIVA